MIIEWMFDLALGFIDVIMLMMGVLPTVSTQITTAVDEIFNFLFSGVNLMSIFVDINMVKILIPIVIGIINLDKIVKLVMFVLKKIPIVNIK